MPVVIQQQPTGPFILSPFTTGRFKNIEWGPTAQLHMLEFDIGSPAPLILGDIDRASADGAFYGMDRYGVRIINAKFETKDLGSINALNSLTAEIDRAMAIIRKGSEPLYFDGANWCCFVRPGPFHVDRKPLGRKLQSAVIDMQWRAADPYIYSGTEFSENVPMAIPPGGLLAPVKAPIILGGFSGGMVDVNNFGTMETSPFFTIQGPVPQGFVLENLTTGGLLQVNYGLTGASWLTVDMGRGMILEQNIASKRNLVQWGTKFWALVPGINTIRFRGLQESAPGGVANMRYRPARQAI